MPKFCEDTNLLPPTSEETGCGPLFAVPNTTWWSRIGVPRTVPYCYIIASYCGYIIKFVTFFPFSFSFYCYRFSWWIKIFIGLYMITRGLVKFRMQAYGSVGLGLGLVSGVRLVLRLLDNSRIRQLADCQLADWTTRGLDISRTWSSRGLDNSRTGQVADWTTRGCHRRLCVLSFPFWRHHRELSSPRVGNPRVGVSASCPVTSINASDARN